MRHTHHESRVRDLERCGGGLSEGEVGAGGEDGGMDVLLQEMIY